MAWDDAPPTPEELKSAPPAGGGTSWADAPPTPDELKGVSKLESAARGAGNNFPLLPQAIAEGGAIADQFKGKDTGDKISTALKALISGHMDTGPAYSEHLEDWKQKAADAKKANPKSYGAGAVAGSFAPLLIPGVGEALEAAPIAGNAALGAMSAVSDTDLRKDPEGAALEALVGGATGGATAGVLKGILPSSSSLDELANKTAIKSLDLPAGELVDMTPAERSGLGEFARDNGLVHHDNQVALERARELSDNFGQKIGEVADQTGAEGLRLDPAEHYKAVQGLQDKADEWKSNALPGGEGQDAGTPLPDSLKMRRSYQGGADAIKNLPANPSWNDIQALKMRVGKLAFNSKGEVVNEGMKDTYFTLKDMLNSIAEKGQENPNLPDEYKAALAGYSQMHPIVKGLEKTVDAELRGGGSGIGARGMAGVIRQMPGPARAVAGAAALATGHPILAGAAALPEIMDPAVQSKALEMASQAAPEVQKVAARGISDRLMDMIHNRPEVLGHAAGMLKEAAQRGPEALATTHFLLQQNDDEYRKKFQDAEAQ